MTGKTDSQPCQWKNKPCHAFERKEAAAPDEMPDDQKCAEPPWPRQAVRPLPLVPFNPKIVKPVSAGVNALAPEMKTFMLGETKLLV